MGIIGSTSSSLWTQLGQQAIVSWPFSIQHQGRRSKLRIICLLYTSVVGSWVDYAAGIRIGGHGRRNYLVSQVHTSCGNSRPRIPRLVELEPVADADCKSRTYDMTGAANRNVLYNARLLSSGCGWLWAKLVRPTYSDVSESFCRSSNLASVQFTKERTP